MISIARRQGTIETDKSKILSSIFQFSKRRVKDIMIPRDKISAISVDASLVQVLDFVRQENHSRYPVFNQSLDRIVGFFHARDLFGILRSHGFAQGAPTALGEFSLRTCLRRAFFVSEHSMISRVMNEMKTNRIHLAIVKDEWGNVVGLVTLEDILEEVVGEIEDEHDEHLGKPVVDLYSAGVELEGTELLVDLKSKFGIEMEPTESYSTVNGFLMHYASHQQLTAKTVVIWKNYVFSISSVKDGEVERVRITEIPEDEKKD
jgi:putative hemolysin